MRDIDRRGEVPDFALLNPGDALAWFLWICFGPVVGRGFGGLKRAKRLEAQRHGGVVTGHDFVMIDIKQPKPALLPEREPDHAADLDQFGFPEVRIEAVPERIV